MTDEEKLSADSSPNTMEMKSKASRRLNNRPMLIAFFLLVLIGGVIAWVMAERSTQQIVYGVNEQYKAGSARGTAEDIVGDRVGMVPPKKPEPVAMPEAPPPPAPKREEPHPPPQVNVQEEQPATETMPRLTEEEIRMRQRKIRRAETAIDSAIKAKYDDSEIRATVNDQMASVERQLALLGRDGKAGADRASLARSMLAGGEQEPDYNSRSDLTRLEQFEVKPGQFTNEARVKHPRSNYVLLAGDVIPATLQTAINSDLTGMIVAGVRRDVYDSVKGLNLLIPKNSLLIGQYDAKIDFGQKRVFAVWQLLRFPDGRTIELGAMPATMPDGSTGAKDLVNNHFWEQMRSALVMSAVLAGVQMTQNNVTSNSSDNRQRMADAMSESLGNVYGNLIVDMIRRQMDVSPTLEVRDGFKLNCIITKDTEFDGPYRAYVRNIPRR